MHLQGFLVDRFREQPDYWCFYGFPADCLRERLVTMFYGSWVQSIMPSFLVKVTDCFTERLIGGRFTLTDRDQIVFKEMFFSFLKLC